MLNPLKPWYVYRPGQLFRRCLSSVAPRRGDQLVRLPWGDVMLVDCDKTIGASLTSTGVYELAVSEFLWRMVQPGDCALDVGANVGYTMMLMARRAGPNGRVLAFEPHPLLCQRLRANANRLQSSACHGRIDVLESAVSDRVGIATLSCPAAFRYNDGVASIGGSQSADDVAIQVQTTTLDVATASVGNIAVLKLDVEGHEFSVLNGARNVLQSRVRHILFEDHEGPNSPSVALLRELGFSLFSLGWSMRQLLVYPVEHFARTSGYESPNFVATRDESEVLTKCDPRGWQVLRG